MTVALAGCSSPTNDRATEGTPAGSTATSGTTSTATGTGSAATGTGGASGTGSSTATGTGGTQTGSGGAQAGTGGTQGGWGPSPDDAGGGGTAEADGSTATTVPGAGACVMPTGSKFMDAATAYAKWKVDLITTSGAGGFVRVTRPNSPGNAVNSTASEGIGYGMLVAVYMDEQDVFDKLWKYEQLHLNARGLMDWQIDPEGTAPSGTGAATDGDEDMAFALIMADKKWGALARYGHLSQPCQKAHRPHLAVRGGPRVGRCADARRPIRWRADHQHFVFRPRVYSQFGKVTGKQPSGPVSWTRVIASSLRP